MSGTAATAAAMVRRLPADAMVVPRDGRRPQDGPTRRADQGHTPRADLRSYRRAASSFAVTKQVAVLDRSRCPSPGRLVIDLVFYPWSLRQYRQWVGVCDGNHHGAVHISAAVAVRRDAGLVRVPRRRPAVGPPAPVRPDQ